MAGVGRDTATCVGIFFEMLASLGFCLWWQWCFYPLLNLDETMVVKMSRDRVRSRDEEGGGRGARDARRRVLAPNYFQECNLDAQGRYIDECSMHALNSTRVNCLDRPRIERWSNSDIPQQLVKGYKLERPRAEHHQRHQG